MAKLSVNKSRRHQNYKNTHIKEGSCVLFVVHIKMAEDMEAIRKAQRRKEIEEKRLKLQEMRKKKDDQV